MKTGVLGTGLIVQYLALPALKESGSEVSILTTGHSIEKTEKLLEEYGSGKYYLDYEEMLKEDLDVVYIALPNHLHFSYAKKALLSGKHVILEKPFVSNVKEFNELKQLAEEKKLMMFEAMSLYYLPAFKKLKEEVNKMEDIKLISFNYSQKSSRYEKFKEGEILPAFDYHKSGGCLMDINIYNTAAVIALFGKPERVSYSANISNGIDTSGVLLMEYPDFKAVCIGSKDSGCNPLSLIQAEKETIVIPKTINAFNYFYKELNNEKKEFNIPQDKNHFIYEFTEFLNIIKNEDYPAANALLERTELMMNILDQARKSAGIVFDAD